jgi:hypothetical protein
MKYLKLLSLTYAILLIISNCKQVSIDCNYIARDPRDILYLNTLTGGKLLKIYRKDIASSSTESKSGSRESLEDFRASLISSLGLNYENVNKLLQKDNLSKKAPTTGVLPCDYTIKFKGHKCHKISLKTIVKKASEAILLVENSDHTHIRFPADGIQVAHIEEFEISISDRFETFTFHIYGKYKNLLTYILFKGYSSINKINSLILTKYALYFYIRKVIKDRVISKAMVKTLDKLWVFFEDHMRQIRFHGYVREIDKLPSGIEAVDKVVGFLVGMVELIDDALDEYSPIFFKIAKTAVIEDITRLKK